MTEGKIIKALSGFYYVKTTGGITECRAPGIFRKKKITPLVGDGVIFEEQPGGKGVLKEILERRNSFRRPAVSNVDKVVILAANVNPVTDPFLIDRITAIAEWQKCDAVICVNKSDLDRGDELFDTYIRAGFTTIRLSSVTGEGREELLDVLKGCTSVLTGNSGVGKSSVLNMLSPGLNLATGEVSDKLGRGRHTTRHTELFELENGAMVMDTPGFSAFDTEEAGLIIPENIQLCFREFAPFREECMFQGCSHMKEKGCAVLNAVKGGTIPESRHRSYASLYENAKKIPAWEREKYLK